MQCAWYISVAKVCIVCTVWSKQLTDIVVHSTLRLSLQASTSSFINRTKHYKIQTRSRGSTEISALLQPIDRATNQSYLAKQITGVVEAKPRNGDNCSTSV